MAKRIRKKTKAELGSPAFQRQAVTQAEVLRLSYAQCEKLSKSRRQYVLDIAGDHWTHRFPSLDDAQAVARESRKWARLRDEFVESADEPLEIHCFTWNYDAHRGMAPLIKLMKNPRCDAGTALRLYWVNDPYYYSQYAGVADCPYREEQDAMRLLRTIKLRFERKGFASRKIPFDPTPWLTDGERDADSLGVPEIMRAAVPAPGKSRG
jgi:hypothetical protein